MHHLVLILITLNVRTGAFLKSQIVERSFASEAKCMQALLARGPQRSNGGTVDVLVCGSDNPADVST